VFFGGVDEWVGVSTAVFTGPIKTGQIQCIGCTTVEGFERYIRSDRDFEHNFETVRLGDPNLDEVIEILSQRRSDLERHHLVAIPDETVARAAELSNNKPTLAEALLDRAASHVRRRAGELPDDLKTLQGEIRNLRLRQDNLVIEQDFEAAANTRDDVKKLMEELIRRETEWRDALGEQRPGVTPDDVISVAVDDDTNENGTAQNPR